MNDNKQGVPTPIEMAETVSNQMTLHPDFYKEENREMLFDFIYALNEVLMSKFENGELESHKIEDNNLQKLTTFGNERLNEQIKRFKDITNI